MCSRTPKKSSAVNLQLLYSFAAKSVRIDALDSPPCRKSTHVLETGGERIRNVFEMEERSRSGKRQLFKFWGKCPSKSADGRGERFMKKPHRLPAGAASTLRRDRLLAGSASTEEPAVMKAARAV